MYSPDPCPHICPLAKIKANGFFFSFDWPSYEPRHLQTWKNSKRDAKLNLMCSKTTICNEVIITHYLDFQTPSPMNFPYTKINSDDFLATLTGLAIGQDIFRPGKKIKVALKSS